MPPKLSSQSSAGVFTRRRNVARINNLDSFQNHPWLCKVYCKLSNQEISLMRNFASLHDHYTKGNFEKAVTRMFMDKPVKPKHWKEIEELLLCANSALK